MSETTKIIQCFLPPMVAGSYNVEVNQTIIKDGVDVTLQANPGADKPGINKSFDFGVDAARFTLNPTDIYSVYPPSGQFGNYSESLPHVVFTRRTLPWERTIDGDLPEFQRTNTPDEKRNAQESPPVPWMGVILFNEDEMKGLKIDKSTIADIIQPGKDGIIRPEIYNANGAGKLKLMDWEDAQDPKNGCFTIDISKEQFEKHIPSKKSLSFLAHAKEVSIVNKDKNGITDINPEGTGVFSVMVGNSLPAPGKQHTALLVSLEGYADYLNDAPPADFKKIPVGKKARLVVLANWGFTNSGEATFLELVKGVETKSMRIQRNGEAQQLKDYFDLGYAPLEHLTRNGATTLSWYHGPFLPRLSPKMSKSISFSSSDAALRYDRSTGFFDVSFAAAWQLGRMLALQNQGFSRAILKWRIVQKQNEVDQKRKKAIENILTANGNISSNGKNDTTLKNKVISYLGHLNDVTITFPEVPVPEPLKWGEPDPLPGDIPKDVKDFLGELYRLNGVPFGYLVPHEFFLEKQHTDVDKQLNSLQKQLDDLKLRGKESDQQYTVVKNQYDALKKQLTQFSGTLSFFYVDPNWIEALLDGALSIGRVNNTDTILDKAMSGQFNIYFDQKDRSIPVPGSGDSVTVKNLNVTGFLLRSDLVSGWRGLEIEAYDATDKLLSALRFERVDSDIFMGIFNGNVAKIVITQPYEGLHFGIKSIGNGYQKNLKNEDGSNLSVSDGSADLNQEINNGLIKDRILDVAGLANVMQQKLTKKNWMNKTGESKGKYFTSAEFAYQMVDSPVKFTIAVKMDIN